MMLGLPRLLEIDRPQLFSHVTHAECAPYIVMQEKPVAVSSLYECCTLYGDSTRNDCRTHDAIVFCKKNSRKKIEVFSSKVAKRVETISRNLQRAHVG